MEHLSLKDSHRKALRQRPPAARPILYLPSSLFPPRSELPMNFVRARWSLSSFLHDRQPPKPKTENMMEKTLEEGRGGRPLADSNFLKKKSATDLERRRRTKAILASSLHQFIYSTDPRTRVWCMNSINNQCCEELKKIL